MFWGFAFLSMSAVFFVLVGHHLGRKGKLSLDRDAVSIAIMGSIFCSAGGLSLNYAGSGAIANPGRLPDGAIYKVLGQVPTSQEEKVFILETGNYEILATWPGETSSPIPAGTKFVRRNGRMLEAVPPAEEPKKFPAGRS